MDRAYEILKDLKCLKCVHAELCLKNLGGTDLIMAAQDCKHFAEQINLPEKFWILFDVPGFYNITEYEVEKVLYSNGKIERLWGVCGKNHDTAYAADFGSLVFFSEEAAKVALDKILVERRKPEKEIELCSCWHLGYNGWYCSGTREQDPCKCGGDKTKCDFYDYIRKQAVEDARN